MSQLSEPDWKTNQEKPKSVSGGRRVLVALALIAMTIAVYAPVFGCEFVNFDDDQYVTRNPHLQEGLSISSGLWALSTFYFSNWHPVVWWSLLLDRSIFGLDHPAGFHLSSLLWHTGSVLMLFLALERLTKEFWPSALVAALFAIHPQNVEAVSWISERKGQISTFFWMLTLWFYAGYVRKPTALRYAFVTLGLALGLMAKQMLVTLPFVLLLLDYWPLQRLTLRGHGALGPASRQYSSWVLLREKVPLFVLVALASYVAVFAQREAGSIAALKDLSLSARIGNSLVSYVLYLRNAIFPMGLAAYYAHPREALPLWQAIAAAIFLLALTILTVRNMKRAPYLIVGWLWFIGTLVPVIGLVQVGLQARADRYGYVPMIGLFIAGVWLGFSLARKRSQLRLLAYLSCVLLAYFGAMAWAQTLYWTNGLILWNRVLTVSGGATLGYRNFSLAYQNLGTAELEAGQIEKGIAHLRQAVALNPDDALAQNSLGYALDSLGSNNESLLHYKEALRVRPDYVEAHNNLALAFMKRRDYAQAAEHFKQALICRPDQTGLYYFLGFAEQMQEHWPQAERCYRVFLNSNPADVGCRRELAFVLHEQGRLREAAEEYDESLRQDPDWPKRVLDEAWSLATAASGEQRDGARALQLATQLRQATGDDNPLVLDCVAAAYAELGQFAEAIELARRARARALSAHRPLLAEDVLRRSALYLKKQPFRTPAQNQRTDNGS